MENKIQIDDKNFLSYRPTPWDARVFNLKTCELLDIKYQDRNALDVLLDLFDRRNKDDGIDFTYTRIDANDRHAKQALQRKGFYYAETSLVMVNNAVSTVDYGEIFRDNLELTIAEEHDFEQIRMIARDAFEFSRFHEDLNIDSTLSRQRYYDWIDDLRSQNKRFLVNKKTEIVNSFLIYEVSGRDVNLILSGSAVAKGFLSPFFWSSFMTYFKKQGYKRASAIVSAANIAIINLYIMLRFSVGKSLIGFHKKYQGG